MGKILGKKRSLASGNVKIITVQKYQVLDIDVQVEIFLKGKQTNNKVKSPSVK